MVDLNKLQFMKSDVPSKHSINNGSLEIWVLSWATNLSVLNCLPSDASAHQDGIKLHFMSECSHSLPLFFTPYVVILQQHMYVWFVTKQPQQMLVGYAYFSNIPTWNTFKTVPFAPCCDTCVTPSPSLIHAFIMIVLPTPSVEDSRVNLVPTPFLSLSKFDPLQIIKGADIQCSLTQL